MSYISYSLILLFVFIGFNLISCTTNSDSTSVSIPETFKQMGLSERTVYKLQFLDEHLFAGTDSGLYRSEISQNSWEPLGMIEASIRTFIAFSDQKILSPLNFGDGDSLTIGKTVNGGQNWVPFRNGFGGGDLTVIPLALAVHPDSPDILYARGLFNVAKSTNQGRSWESVFATWETIGSSKFVTIDPNNPAIIWAGGANAFSAINLIISTDGGNNWKRLDENVQKLVFESFANDLIIKHGTSSNVLLGISDGILRSNDMGDNWQSVYSGASIHTLTRTSQNPKVIYASGSNSQGNLFFLRTRDFGNTWQTVEMDNSPSGIQVNDMIAVESNDREILYFATNNGVYNFVFSE